MSGQALTPAAGKGGFLTTPERKQLAALWPILPDELQGRLVYWRSALADGLAPSTVTNKISDWRQFAIWVREETDLPFLSLATPGVLIRYFDEHTHLAKATLDRRHSSLVDLFDILGYAPKQNPAASRELHAHLRKIRREGRHGPPRGQVAPLNWDEHIERILEALDPDGPPEDARIRLVLGLMYEGLLRRGELVNLRARDLRSADDTPLGEGHAEIFIEKSKTDQERAGAKVYCSQTTARWGAEWIEQWGLQPDHFLICRLDADGRPVPSAESRIPGQDVVNLIRNAAKRAGFKPDHIKRLAGHSPRVGHAQDLAVKGKTLLEIQVAGRWKNGDMVYRYVENIMLSRGAAAELAKERGRSPGLKTPAEDDISGAMNSQNLNITLEALQTAKRLRPSINIEEVMVLLHLVRTGQEVTLQHLVQQLDLAPSTASKLIGGLQGDKDEEPSRRLVESRPRENDLSTKLVQASDAGQAFVEKMVGA